MRLSLRSKLLLSYLALLLVMSAATYAYLNHTLHQSIVGSLQENLANEAKLTAVMAAGNAERIMENAPALAAEVGRTLTARVTIINPQGTVIGDSVVERDKLAELENHLDRPEVMGALLKGQGSAIRYSSSLRTDMLYVAVPLVVNGRGAGVVRLSLPLATVDKSLAKMHTMLGIGLLVALVLAMIFSDLLARITLRPLRQVAVIASRIGDGDFSQRLPTSWRDELGELGRVINDMSDRIEKNIAVRRDFVANVSHELRNPVAVISGYAETIVNGRLVETDPERAIRFTATIHSHAVRLTRLLDDVLDLSRLEAATVGISPRLWRLEDILRSVCQLFEQRLAEKGVALELSGIAGCLVMVDRERIEQVFINLLDNALKYSYSGGKISITAATDGDRVEIALADSGVGIPEEHLSRIFERFYRVDPGRSRELGGTGLGLAIVKHIIQQHGGSISVSSRPGQGTTFRFSLPLPAILGDIS